MLTVGRALRYRWEELGGGTIILERDGAFMVVIEQSREEETCCRTRSCCDRDGNTLMNTNARCFRGRPRSSCTGPWCILGGRKRGGQPCSITLSISESRRNKCGMKDEERGGRRCLYTPAKSPRDAHSLSKFSFRARMWS